MRPDLEQMDHKALVAYCRQLEAVVKAAKKYLLHTAWVHPDSICGRAKKYLWDALTLDATP